jgi:hypothetical protein
VTEDNWVLADTPARWINLDRGSYLTGSEYDKQDGAGPKWYVSAVVDGVQYYLPGTFPDRASAMDGARKLCQGLDPQTITGGS